jgi:hypothetical protein
LRSHVGILWRSKLSKLVLVIAVLGTAVVGGATYVDAQSNNGGIIKACVNRNSGAIRIVKDNFCGSPLENLLTWNQGATGPAGPTGATGSSGSAGQPVRPDRLEVARPAPPGQLAYPARREQPARRAVALLARQVRPARLVRWARRERVVPPARVVRLERAARRAVQVPAGQRVRWVTPGPQGHRDRPVRSVQRAQQALRAAVRSWQQALET